MAILLIITKYVGWLSITTLSNYFDGKFYVIYKRTNRIGLPRSLAAITAAAKIAWHEATNSEKLDFLWRSSDRVH
jgi:hypothetical protein